MSVEEKCFAANKLSLEILQELREEEERHKLERERHRVDVEMLSG